MPFPLIKNTTQGSKLLIFMLLLIFGLVFSGVLGLFLQADLQLAQAISQIVGFMIPPVLYVLLVKEKPFQYLGFRSLPNWSLLGIVAMFTVIPLVATVAAWNDALVFPESMKAIEQQLRNINELANNVLEQMMSGNSLFSNLLIIAALAAVSEELLFRSVLQKALIKVIRNPHVAIIVTAILFSAFHGDFFGFLPRVILGLMLGYMFYLSGSIFPSMLMHFVNNATIVMLYYLNTRGFVDIDAEHFGNTDNVLVILLSLITSVAIFITCYRFSKRQDSLFRQDLQD